jgi:hypothetical protein
MSLQNAAPTLMAFGRYFTRPCCPHGGVRHAWRCEDCDHDFCTTIEFGRIAA